MVRSFDVVILGAGAGAKLVWNGVRGRSVAVVEPALVGGRCPFLACVPSKAMLRAATAWRLAREGRFTGLFTGAVPAREAYSRAVAHRERLVNGRDDGAAAAALERTGAELLRGRGRVVRPGVVEVADTEVGYRDLVLNTGSVPEVPDVPGLAECPTWTSEQAMSTDEYPESLLVLGGGAVGCETAYLFAAFGCAVTLVQRGPRLIPREEDEASEEVAQALERVGVRVLRNTTPTGARRHGGGARVRLADGRTVEASRILFATGRRPDTSGLGLEVLGLHPEPGAPLTVDDRCRVAGAQNLWAVGDVTGVSPFTHTAHYQGRVVAANLSGHVVRADYRGVPRTVYTDPVLASVGHTEASARAAGIDPLVAAFPVSGTVRSAIDDAREGWVKLVADSARGVLVGATAMGGRAEEWISEVSQAVRAELPVATLVDTVHPFPTFSEALEGPLWELASRLPRAVAPAAVSGAG